MNKRLIVGLVLMVLPFFLFAEDYAKTPNYADCRIVEFFELDELLKIVSRVYEHVIVYTPLSDAIFDVTLVEGDRVGVRSNFWFLQEIFNEEEHVVTAHCHIVNFKQFLFLWENGALGNINLSMEKERARETVCKLGPDVFYQRCMEYAPSLRDIIAILSFEKDFYQAQSKGTAEHRIVVLKKNQPPRIINYGLTEKTRKKYRDLWHVCEDEAWDFEEKLQKHYKEIISSFKKEHCKFNSLGPCKNPTFQELAKRVNASGKFFIEDRGYIIIE